MRRDTAGANAGPGRGSGGPWGLHELAERGAVKVGIGPLHLHLREHDGEIQIAWERENQLKGSSAEDSELEWSRWAPRRWDGRIGLAPEFPDRPVVVAPESTFHLLPEAEARIFVRVPLFVRIEAHAPEGPTVLERIPTLVASDTWWGSPMEGELCYWLTTSARRTVRPELFAGHLVICPLQLRNRSEGTLEVEKIALRVGYLSIFGRDGRLWADETRVRYQGETEESHLDTTGRPPPEEPDAVLLTPPRSRTGRGFRARTFSRLRSLQPWI